MTTRQRTIGVGLLAVVLCGVCGPAVGQPTTTAPAKVYVPYEKLKGVFENEKQGVFLPYAEFQRLWQAAAGIPASAQGAPVQSILSVARFSGRVGTELASMHLELTVDVLADDWVEVPIGLGEVAVTKAEFLTPAKTALPEGGAVDMPEVGRAVPRVEPLLRVVDGQYVLLVQGRGRRVLAVDFARQLVTKPGLNVLSFRTPPASITTLELLIPEPNMKVDVTPMLAKTTIEVDEAGKKATRLQAFLGAGGSVEMKWQPTSQVAEELEPVVICEQVQHVSVTEALVSYDVTLNYDIRRRGVDSFSVQLPPGFRVTTVEGANISKWDLAGGPPAKPGPDGSQLLQVKLFSPEKEKYTLTIRLERFVQEAQATLGLTPIVAQQALRQTGLLAVSHSPRRSVELRDAKNLARVDVGQLPQAIRGQPGVLAYRFLAADYAGTLAIDTVEPRISVNHLWAVGADSDRLELHGQLACTVERVGVFQLAVRLAEQPVPWEVLSVGPADVVDSHQLVGAGADRKLNILLKRELTGAVTVVVKAQASRPAADAPVDFALPLVEARNLQQCTGQVMLLLADQLRAEVEQLDQLNSLPLGQAAGWTSMRSLTPAMAFEFRAVDRARAAGARFKLAIKPTQISAVVHRLVNIQPGSVEQEAVIQYRILYAPVDTLYVKMPAALADAGVEIIGSNIKEKPRLDELPADQRAAERGVGPATQPDEPKWAYYKVVLQSPVSGSYQLKVNARRSFQSSEAGAAATVKVEPILAAGRLSDQSGHIAVAKADTLAILEPTARNLLSGDPGSSVDLPHEPHRRVASLAFKYVAPPFELALPVAVQKEADVFTVIATGAIIEQVIARDGTLNTYATYLLSTSRGDRLTITLPPKAKLFAVLLNGAEAAVESGATAEQRIVRLRPSAGQVAKLVLEVSYGLDRATAGRLTAPTLPEKVPFQQTLWRLWVPQEQWLLAHDRTFALLEDRQGEEALAAMAVGQPVAVGFKLPGQGRAWDFLRQGSPGTLTVRLVSREPFSFAVWAVVIVLGLLMLPMRGFARSLVVLAVLLAAFCIQLYLPLLVRQVLVAGRYAAGIVALLWLLQWMFFRVGRRRPAGPPAPRVPLVATPVGQGAGGEQRVEGAAGALDLMHPQGETPPSQSEQPTEGKE